MFQSPESAQSHELPENITVDNGPAGNLPESADLRKEMQKELGELQSNEALQSQSLYDVISEAFKAYSSEAGYDFSDYRIVITDKFDSPMNIDVRSREGEPTLYVNPDKVGTKPDQIASMIAFVLPHELGHAIDDALLNPSRYVTEIFRNELASLGNILSSHNKDNFDIYSLTTTLAECMTDGIGIQLGVRLQMPGASARSAEGLEASADGFIKVQARGFEDGSILQHIREAAVASVLFRAGAKGKIFAETLDKLQEIERKGMQRAADALGIEEGSETLDQLKEVFALGAKTGMELSIDASVDVQIPNADSLLSRAVGHAKSYSEFVRPLMGAFVGKVQEQMREWYPGEPKLEGALDGCFGKESSERSTWGKLDQVQMVEGLINHYIETLGIMRDEAVQIVLDRHST